MDNNTDIRVFSLEEGVEENKDAVKKAARILEVEHNINFKNKELISTIAFVYMKALLEGNSELKVYQDRFTDVIIQTREDSILFPTQAEIKTGDLVYLDKQVQELEDSNTLDDAVEKLYALKHGYYKKEPKVVEQEPLLQSEKQYEIPVEWSAAENIKVSANSLEEARQIVSNANIVSTNEGYIEGSFRVNEELLEEMYPEESEKF